MPAGRSIVRIRHGLLNQNQVPYEEQRNIILSMIRKQNGKMLISTSIKTEN
ncbi:MAG: hypothetical protein AB7S89_00670 [Candidatus Babeliales bacterium]